MRPPRKPRRIRITLVDAPPGHDFQAGWDAFARIVKQDAARKASNVG